MVALTQNVQRRPDRHGHVVTDGRPENDIGAACRDLVNLGRKHAEWDLPIEIDLPSEDPDRDGAFGWSSSAFLGVFFKSLRVRTKADEAR